MPEFPAPTKSTRAGWPPITTRSNFPTGWPSCWHSCAKGDGPAIAGPGEDRPKRGQPAPNGPRGLTAPADDSKGTPEQFPGQGLLIGFCQSP